MDSSEHQVKVKKKQSSNEEEFNLLNEVNEKEISEVAILVFTIGSKKLIQQVINYQLLLEGLD